MWQHQLIAALILLGAPLVPSLPVNSVPIKDDSPFKAVETIADRKDDNSSSTLPTAMPTAPANDSEFSVNILYTHELSNHTWPGMEDPNLFEGDIKISKEMIDKYYGKLTDEKEDTTNSTKNRPVRSAVRDRDFRWSNRQIHYAFDSSVSSGLQANIRTAMNTIEQQTCLRFFHHSNQRDYIWFTSFCHDGCSSHIGQKGGYQEITLGPGCNNVGTIIHEIGHALGLWHEQSRPDRDRYIQVLYDNIEPDKKFNFEKRNSYEIDYHGTAYDYSSVMHYRRNAFSRNTLDTIVVINNVEYNLQGNPDLGSQTKTRFSNTDATQLNRMYNCPGSGILGIYFQP